MDYKKVALLLLFSAVILAGCLDWLNPQAKDQYEIFSNIPTDNAKALAYFKFNENGAKELRSLFGTILTKNLNRINESEAAIVIYNDSLGIVTYSKTDLTINDEIDSLKSQMGQQKNWNMRVENKSIGGKDVTIIYMNMTDTELPVCMWKEGDVIKTLMMIGSPQQTAYPPSVGFENPAQSPMLGYALRAMSSPQGNFKNTCDVVMTQKYDTSNVKAMFNETDYIKSSIPVSGKLFGEVKIYAGNNEFINGSVYIVMFGDDSADNLVVAGRADIAKTPILQQTGNYCFSTKSSNDKSTIVQSNGREACMKETTTNLVGPMQLITLQRKVGAYYVEVVTYVKSDANAARENAKYIVFSTNLPGTDASWTDKAKLEVKVYEESYSAGFEHMPIAEVRLDLFKSIPYDYQTYGNYATAPSEELLETKYTNDSGTATFENLPLNESLHLVASKTGYQNQTEYIYSFSSPLNVYLIKEEPINIKVTVRDGLNYSKTLAGARVSAYSGSELLGTNYTNDYGETIIQNVKMGQIRFETRKEGYVDGEVYSPVGRYTTSTSVYLIPLATVPLLANGTMDGAHRLCTQVNVVGKYYEFGISFKNVNDTSSRHMMYAKDCPDAPDLESGCSSRGCPSGIYCNMANRTDGYSMSISMGMTPGVHSMCIWPSSPAGYDWAGQIYGGEMG